MTTPVVALLGWLGLGPQAVLRLDHDQPASGKVLLERIGRSVVGLGVVEGDGGIVCGVLVPLHELKAKGFEGRSIAAAGQLIATAVAHR